MNRFLNASALLALAFSFVGCEKTDELPESNNGMIEIFAESMSGGGKVLLDGADATWVDGDSIRINSDKVAVVRQNGHAYIRYAADDEEVIRAVYPASLASGNLTSDNANLTFPAYYHYRTDGEGHQLLDLPMAAYSDGSSSLQFKHLTGALYVTVTNDADMPLTLMSVTVASNAYLLNGLHSVDFTNLENIQSVNSSNESQKEVTLLFDDGYALSADASVKVMIPVLPVGGGGGGTNNNLTIRVKSYSPSENKFYLYSNTQASGSDHVLLRNELGYAPVSVTATGEDAAVLNQADGNYIVQSPLDFLLMTQNLTNGTLPSTANIDITSDIDMSGIPITTIRRNDFTGTINGNNHTISNLTINSVSVGNEGYYCALFAKSGTNIRIKNITFNHLTLHHEGNTANTLRIGGLISSITSSGTFNLENCHIQIDSVSTVGATSSIFFGGLLCEKDDGIPSIVISNCSVITPHLIMSGQSFYWGAFIGSAGNSTVTVTNSRWSGAATINASSAIRIGGIIGNKTQGSFSATDCTLSGTIDASAPYGRFRTLGTLIGYFSTPHTESTSNLSMDVSFSLNDTVITPSTYGTTY